MQTQSGMPEPTSVSMQSRRAPCLFHSMLAMVAGRMLQCTGCWSSEAFSNIHYYHYHRDILYYLESP